MAPVGELRSLEGNPRQGDLDSVTASIDQFGFRYPIVVRGGEVIAGNTRLRAAVALGYGEVPVVDADDLSDAEAAAFVLADNRTSDLGQYDDQLLADMLLRVDDASAIPGFDADYLADIEESILLSGLAAAGGGGDLVEGPSGISAGEATAAYEQSDVRSVVLSWPREEHAEVVDRLALVRVAYGFETNSAAVAYLVAGADV